MPPADAAAYSGLMRGADGAPLRGREGSTHLVKQPGPRRGGVGAEPIPREASCSHFIVYSSESKVFMNETPPLWTRLPTQSEAHHVTQRESARPWRRGEGERGGLQIDPSEASLNIVQSVIEPRLPSIS